MILSGADVRAAYWCAAQVIRGRELHSHQVPPPVRALFDRLDAEVRMSRARHESDSRTAQLGSDQLIGVNEAADILGWTKRKVQRHATDLDGKRVAGQWVFSRSAVIEYLEGGSGGPAG